MVMAKVPRPPRLWFETLATVIESPGGRMSRKKVIDADAAARVILDGDTVAVGGFVGIAVPEVLAAAVEQRFIQTGSPRDLTLVFAAGAGDRGTRGLNHFGRAGMVRRAIGGHFGLAPALGRLAIENSIEAYCLPQGVVSHLFRDIAAGRPGVISRVGLGTFVDPRVDGAKLNQRAVADVVHLIEVAGEEYLFYPTFGIDVGLIRGTTADEEGNLSLEREAITTDVLAIAQAVKNSGGIVIAQVERVTSRHTLPPQMVRVPGILVDAVVVAEPQHHLQTFAEPYNPAYTGEIHAPITRPQHELPLDARTVIARRAARFLRWNSVVNLGIGMPEGVATVAAEEGVLDLITLTVEPGAIGGVPASGLSFGASANPQSIIDQSAMFDFYDGGGLDQAYLGFAEIDAAGNVNVSRFGNRLAGAGGFINISQNVSTLFFLGTFATHSQEEITDGHLHVLHPGRSTKFVKQVSHITFSAAQARLRGQEVRYITERCILRLTATGLEITEIAPGVDLELDVLATMPFRPDVSPDLRTMDPAIFTPGRMGLAKRSVLSPRERVCYQEDADVLYMNFEGLQLETEADAEDLAVQLEATLKAYGRKLAAVVNYDNFRLAPAAAERYWAMVRHNTTHYLSSTTRYSTNAFFRHQLGERLCQARLDGHVYRSFDEAVDHLEPPVSRAPSGA
jgi:propionate CoA-transferase